ncbi:uncharacterized protein LOC127056370 isoform X4 [Gopherus flavomarginatus]|uniref:uncharacterized protein LOC127056370 isoform X4 n=1 Tax=Gopherus flavomarginatus TaxID=286002 RepID=UPI0021CC3E69|nr:uncharacterized protein LOC127056370 isoform X4 [Gopherus flavomarginatus]
MCSHCFTKRAEKGKGTALPGKDINTQGVVPMECWGSVQLHMELTSSAFSTTSPKEVTSTHFGCWTMPFLRHHGISPPCNT